MSFLFWIKTFLKIIYFKPDTIFVHNHDIFPALLYKYLFKKKIIFVAHDPASLFNNIKIKFINKIAAIFFDTIIVLNKDVYLYFKKIKKEKNFNYPKWNKKNKIYQKKI